eukprot:scaffold145368_cov18-Prasinocladus_malaysianus.AAC.1
MKFRCVPLSCKRGKGGERRHILRHCVSYGLPANFSRLKIVFTFRICSLPVARISGPFVDRPAAWWSLA